MPSLVRDLGLAIPELRVSERGDDRVAYSRDLWPRHHIEVRAGHVGKTKPAAIAWPRTTQEVSKVVQHCAAENIALVPYGAGSGVCGGILPTDRTLVMDLKRLKQWRRFSPATDQVEVESGVLGIRLEEELEARGKTVGHFPSSILCSTVGGWIAARGAGQCSGLYGKIEDMVVGLEVVDGRGEVLNLKRRDGGLDLTPLIIGSEGIYGAITAATLRLHDAPQERTYAAFSFPSMAAGYDTIRALIQAGHRPAVCRLYDPFDSMMAKRGAASKARGKKKSARPWAEQLKTIANIAQNHALKLPGPLNAAIDRLGTRAFGGAMLILVFDQNPAVASAALHDIGSMVLSVDGESLGPEPARHWIRHRYSVSYRQAPMFMSGAFVDTMEVAAPWSAFDGLYEGIRSAMSPQVMVMAHMSHAYPDGCSIYFTFAGSASTDAEALSIYDRNWKAALQASLDAGGTVSHHHGVGRSKAEALTQELGYGIRLLHDVRGVIDPAGIFNPGNLYDMNGAFPGSDTPPPSTAIAVDRKSQTVACRGDHQLADVESIVRDSGLSWPFSAVGSNITVDDWIAAGLPGAPNRYADPNRQTVVGFSATLPSGDHLTIRPCPRRAAGPDLLSLWQGANKRFGTIDSAHLSLAPKTVAPISCAVERSPAVTDSEQNLVDRLAARLGRKPGP